MKKDVGWKSYFADNRRYADVVNGAGCHGRQLVKPDDLREADTASRGRARDLLRKTAFGVNFALIGIENQEVVDYKFPLRNLHYEVNEYEKQAAKVRQELKSQKECSAEDSMTAGEYLYGFKKTSKLHPVVTFVLYSGKEPWDGPLRLHDILDFTDIPKEIRDLTADYPIHLIDIRRMEDTSVFRTDVRHVFEFIRCAEDKNALYELVSNEPYYQEMDEEAFEVVRMYTNSEELVGVKAYDGKDGKKDMCQGIKDLIEDGRQEGRQEGLEQGFLQAKLENARNLIGLLPDEVIAEKIGLPLEQVKEIHAEVLTEG